MRRITHATYSIVLALLLSAAPAGAQTASEEAPVGSDAFTHRLAGPGQATMTLYLWGEVSTPGIWKVERDVDLVELLSAAGVPTKANNPQFRERVVLSVFRGASGSRRQVYQKRLSELVAEAGTYPSFQEGDVVQVEVERNNRFGWRDVGTVLGTASSLVLLILRVANL